MFSTIYDLDINKQVVSKESNSEQMKITKQIIIFSILILVLFGVQIISNMKETCLPVKQQNSSSFKEAHIEKHTSNCITSGYNKPGDLYDMRNDIPKEFRVVTSMNKN